MEIEIKVAFRKNPVLRGFYSLDNEKVKDFVQQKLDADEPVPLQLHTFCNDYIKHHVANYKPSENCGFQSVHKSPSMTRDCFLKIGHLIVKKQYSDAPITEESVGKVFKTEHPETFGLLVKKNGIFMKTMEPLDKIVGDYLAALWLFDMIMTRAAYRIPMKRRRADRWLMRHSAFYSQLPDCLRDLLISIFHGRATAGITRQLFGMLLPLNNGHFAKSLFAIGKQAMDLLKATGTAAWWKRVRVLMAECLYECSCYEPPVFQFVSFPYVQNFELDGCDFSNAYSMAALGFALTRWIAVGKTPCVSLKNIGLNDENVDFLITQIETIIAKWKVATGLRFIDISKNKPGPLGRRRIGAYYEERGKNAYIGLPHFKYFIGWTFSPRCW